MVLKSLVPHPKTAPDLDTTIVWFAPQATKAMGIPLKEDTTEGLVSDGLVVPIPN